MDDTELSNADLFGPGGEAYRDKGGAPSIQTVVDRAFATGVPFVDDVYEPELNPEQKVESDDTSSQLILCCMLLY